MPTLSHRKLTSSAATIRRQQGAASPSEGNGDRLPMEAMGHPIAATRLFVPYRI